jgi:hypothetical protein
MKNGLEEKKYLNNQLTFGSTTQVIIKFDLWLEMTCKVPWNMMLQSSLATLEPSIIKQSKNNYITHFTQNTWVLQNQALKAVEFFPWIIVGWFFETSYIELICVKRFKNSCHHKTKVLQHGDHKANTNKLKILATKPPSSNNIANKIPQGPKVAKL